ncbi:DUF4440 domain-containing protein [Saccharopolyspora shandongensis]|uniref:nuclear transport factor 2 family protein n=1 Tax=Saccharopolyspora shandongensis TaxID=418495 RepID=UPI0033EA4949
MTGVDADFDAVIAAELRLLEPEIRNDDDVVLALLHPDFREFGSSGRVWDRESVLQVTGGSVERVAATDFRPTWLGPDAILLTYISLFQGGTALRTSIWARHDGAWRMLHHQGTRVP